MSESEDVMAGRDPVVNLERGAASTMSCSTNYTQFMTMIVLQSVQNGSAQSTGISIRGCHTSSARFGILHL